MTNLTARQRVKINAALAFIHNDGHDAKAVGRLAQSDMARGISPRAAYQRAIRDFTKGKPDLGDRIAHAFRLVEASDDATVASYGEALHQYNETGNPAALQSVADTFAQDSIALAVRNGELAEAEAGNSAAVEAALGFAFDGQSAGRSGGLAGATQRAAAPQPTITSNPPADAATNARTGFSGQGTGWTFRFRSQEEKRAAAAQAEPGQGPAIVKGWTESNVYGG